MYNVAENIRIVRNSLIHQDIICGTETGFPALDKLTGGLWNGELTVLASRPSMGRTSVALNIVNHIAFGNMDSCLFVTLESSADYITKRLLYLHAGLPQDYIIDSFDDYERVSEVTQVFEESNMFIEDSMVLIDDICDLCRLWNGIEVFRLIVIDYLQLIAVKGSQSKRVTCEKVINELKLLARELDCPILLLVKIGRDVEGRADKRPIPPDLKEFAGLDDKADGVWFLYRDDYYNPDSCEKETAEIIVAKNQHGPLGTTFLGYREEDVYFGKMMISKP